MSMLQRFAIAIAVAAVCGSGCCLTQTCGVGGTGACSTPSGCDDDCSSCNGRRGCLLGLGCIGKLFKCSSYGCDTGCGEVYYHDWISDPPCGNDPCDCQGNWTGIPWSGPCGDPTCTGGCAGPACGTGVATEPMYEEVSSACSCGNCGARGGQCMRAPGRFLFNTWAGMGGFCRNVGNGLFPYAGYAGYPTSCASGPCDGSCGGACGVVSSNDTTVSHAVATARLPHKVVNRDIRQAHGRPPHRVVSARLR